LRKALPNFRFDRETDPKALSRQIKLAISLMRYKAGLWLAAQSSTFDISQRYRRGQNSVVPLGGPVCLDLTLTIDDKDAQMNAVVRNIAEIAWQEFPGHFGGALSKALVGPEVDGSHRIDYRISSYQPMAHVGDHVHQVQEQIYHVLEGEGMLLLDGTPHLMRRHDYVFIPPGVRHSFTNNGLTPLVFLVVTSPTEDGETPE